MTNAAWRLVAVLSVVEAGAYVGNEAARYFWDLTAYVEALDTLAPYRFDKPYPFLYPPFALDLFTLARSHLFELFSIAYVAAAAVFLTGFARLNLPRAFEWLLAICAMGGLGVVSLLSGNVGVVMNLTLLGTAFQAATGVTVARHLLPVLVGFGALIKPQFLLYLGLLPILERSWKPVVMKIVLVCVAVAGVHAAYVGLRPNDWNEYTQAVLRRTVVEKDFGWGPAAFANHFSHSNAAAFAGYLVGLLVVGALAYAAWRKASPSDQPERRVFLVSVVFLVLTFANPRMPLYDLFAAAIALTVCCALVDRAPAMPWVLAAALGINILPWLIANFTRVPSAWPWWLRDLQLVHLLGIGSLLLTLSRARSLCLSSFSGDD
jgi:hypothetical protein